MEPYEIKSVIDLKQVVSLFQTTAIFRDLCKDLQRTEPELVESVDLASLEDGYYLLLNRIAKDTNKDAAAMLAAKVSLTIQLSKDESLN